MNQYLAAVRSKRVLKSKSDAKVGIVVASGEILDGHQPPGTIGGESTADLLRQARYDNAVKAVVLRVDSPGGSMFASEQILREVQTLRKAGKPVVVSMSTYAASGGYYISAAANQIFASPTTLDRIDRRVLGGADLPAHPGKARRQGRRHRHHAAGRRHAPGSRARRPLPARSCRASVDHAYAEFLRRVGDGPQEEPSKTWTRSRRGASGRASTRSASDWWTTSAASRMPRDAAAKLAELGADYDVDYIEPELSLREQLLMQLRSRDAAARPDRRIHRAAQRRRAGARSRCSSRRARSRGSTIRAGCTRTAGAASRA